MPDNEDWATALADVIIADTFHHPFNARDLIAMRLRLVEAQGVELGLERARGVIRQRTQADA